MAEEVKLDGWKQIADYLRVSLRTAQYAEHDGLSACSILHDQQMDRADKVPGAYRLLLVEQQAKELDENPPAFPTGKWHVIVAGCPRLSEARGISGLPLSMCRVAVAETRLIAGGHNATCLHFVRIPRCPTASFHLS